MAVDLRLENRDGTISTFNGVLEVAIPQTNGELKVYGLGGSTGMYIATIQARSNTLTPSKQNPAQLSDLEITATATFTVPANHAIKQTDWVADNVGYLMRVYNPDDPDETPTILAAGNASVWNDAGSDYQLMITKTETANPDGSTTITIAYKPFAVGTFARAWVEPPFSSGRVVGGNFYACLNMVVAYYEL